jgi:hypothetical protein
MTVGNPAGNRRTARLKRHKKHVERLLAKEAASTSKPAAPAKGAAPAK